MFSNLMIEQRNETGIHVRKESGICMAKQLHCVIEKMEKELKFTDFWGIVEEEPDRLAGYKI